MDQVLSALFANEKSSDDLRLAYYLLSKETTHTEDKITQTILSNAKSMLLSSKTRHQGLILLSNLLGQLNNDIFTDNCSVLIQPAAKVLQESKNVDERILAYKVLTQIFAKIYRMDSQNLTRDLSRCIPPLLTHCFTDLKSSDIFYASNWLCACATLFPSPVSTKRPFLESKILEAVSTVVNESGDVSTLKTLGFAYTKVMLAGNANVQKYRDFFSKLMNTFGQYFTLYNVFSLKKPSVVLHFENEQCIANFYKEGTDIFICPLKNARRLHFLTAAICALITGQFHSGSIPLPVQGILECLNTFMLLSNGNIKDSSHSVDVFAIAYLLPILYDNIFLILSALVTSCKQNLIVYTRLVNRIVISSIEWLDKHNSVEKRLYLNLRCSLYNFLTLFFNVLGGKTSFIAAEQQLLIKHLLANVKILEPNITFAANGNIHSNSSASTQNATQNRELQAKSTLKAIQVINRILSSMGSSLEPLLYNLIQNEVIHTLLHIYRNWFNLTFPYKNEECRRELIESLNLLLQNPPSTGSLPLESALALFTQAYQIDKSPTVRFQIESCFHLVNFIMSSRISSNYANLPRPPSFFESSSQMNRIAQEQRAIQSASEDVSSSGCKWNQTQEDNHDVSMALQATFSSITGSNEDINSVRLPTFGFSTPAVQGTKRRNSDMSDDKVAEMESPACFDISDDVIELTSSPEQIFNDQQELENKLVKSTESVSTTHVGNKESSEEADDALSYFVE